MTDHAKADVDSGVYNRRYQLKKGDIVLDLGAHVGHYSRYALEQVGPTGKVVAFEPHPDNFAKLEEISADNFFRQRVAATDFDGVGVLYENPGNDGGHSLYHKVDGGKVIEVKTCAIGKWWGFAFHLPNFIKIDAEGAEAHILRSLMAHDIRCPMAVEIHSLDLFDECKSILASNQMLLAADGNPVGVCYVSFDPPF